MLTLSRISKRFGDVIALDDASFDVSAGEVHALLGENGAGKTTLMRVAYGLIRPDAGTIEVGATIRKGGFASPAEARDAGIGMVHQHFTSIPAFTVGENIALAAGWPETGHRAEARAAAIIDRLGLPLDPTARVDTLSVQLRQRVEIVKALAANARILLLDEPSAVLAPREVRELLQVVRAFAAAGGAAVLITHKLDEVFQVADRVTVLRNGRVMLAGPLASQSPQSLARAMIGTELTHETAIGALPGEVLVRARGLCSGRIVNASFDLRAGEIIGIAAIEGNGQRDLLRAIAGLQGAPVEAGVLEVARPVAFIPEDRTTEGLIPEFTVTENVLLGTLDSAPMWLDWKAIRMRAARLVSEFDVRAPGTEVPVGTLSGGNQQKLMFARAFERHPRVLIAEDPTRGLDIHSTEAIHLRLRVAARAGVVVIVHSSDLDEVMALADRVFVVADGELRELAKGSAKDEVGDAMLGLVKV